MLWRRLDVPGHDYARWVPNNEDWRLDGVALFADKTGANRLDYSVACDVECRTCYARVGGWAGNELVNLDISVSPDQRWWLNGIEQTSVQGCLDLDLSFTPATNSLPIRRMMRNGEWQIDVVAAWLDFPELTLQPLRQRYRRVDDRTYGYEAPELGFSATLEIDADGLPLRYPGLWQAEEQALLLTHG